MRIEFLKDYKDPRPNRTKTFKKGKVTVFEWSWAAELVDKGIARPVNISVSLAKMEKKLKKAGIETNNE